MPVWFFEPKNREVRFIVRYFAERDQHVVKLSWRGMVKGKGQVSPGDELADLTWSDGNEEVLTAPPKCRGAIEVVNRRIAYEALDKDPSQWALRLTQRH
jgi:hypothetical protein